MRYHQNSTQQITLSSESVNSRTHRTGRKLISLAALGMSLLMPFSAQAAAKKKAVAIKVSGSHTVDAGKQAKLKVKTSAKAKISFKSSNKRIATVSKKGVITGKAAGTVKITITAKPVKTKKYKKTTASFVVRVNQKVNKITINTAAQNIGSTNSGNTNTVKVSIKENVAGAEDAKTAAPVAEEIRTPLGGNLNILAGPEKTYTVAGTQVNGLYNTDMAGELIALVNSYRKANGLNELAGSQVLTSAAGTRALEATAKFSHTRPDGSKWVTVSPYASGENLACGYNSAQEIFNAWVKSPTHNSVMLGDGFKAVGVGVFVKRTSVFGINMDSYFVALEMGR